MAESIESMEESTNATHVTEKPQQEDEISLLDLLAALGRKKHIAIRTIAVMLVIGILLAFLLPKKFTAEVTLLPPQQQSSLSSMLSSQLGGLGAVASLAGGGLGLKNPNDRYIAMFKSQTVEDAMIRKYGLMAEYHAKLMSAARKAFEGHVKLDGTTKDGLIHISVTDRSPARAAELANGYVEQFRKLSEHLAISEASQRRLFYQQQMAEAKSNLTNAEEALVKTEEKSGMIQVGSQAEALIQSGAQLRAQIAAKEVEIQGLQAFAAPGNPNLLQAQQELAGLRAQLAKLAGSGGNTKDQLIVPQGKLPVAGLDYLRKYRDVTYYQTIFNVLAQQYELAKIDEAKEGALIQVVDPAIPPDHKSAPKRLLILAGCLFAGIFLGVMLALLAEGWDHLNQDPHGRQQIEAVRQAFRRRPAKP
ncbi:MULTISPECIES: GNVR domain-containing protein [Acidobacterium]|nr:MULTISPECIES: GNVR domain-containing protein [Acidobacterium]HCT59752.1 chain length determinant family protein [Acidobacterium sp.]